MRLRLALRVLRGDPVAYRVTVYGSVDFTTAAVVDCTFEAPRDVAGDPVVYLPYDVDDLAGDLRLRQADVVYRLETTHPDLVGDEAAHRRADALLLAFVPLRVREAYYRVVRRAEHWTCR